MTTFRTPRRTDRYEFDLAGDVVDDRGEYTGEEWAEHFRCLPELPGSALDKLGKSVGVNDRGEQVYNRPSVIGFIEEAMPADEAARFLALVADRHRVVGLDTLAEVMKAINAYYNGPRPTTP